MSGSSSFTCLPDGMSHGHSAGPGTVMRPDTLRGYARQAGFDDVEVLPNETDFWPSIGSPDDRLTAAGVSPRGLSVE